MPNPRVQEPDKLRSGDSMPSGTALRSTKAGLVAVLLISVAFATFGPWFNLTLGYGLMLASMVVAVFGIWWADRAAHEARRDPTRANGIYAKSGAALSLAALGLSMYYTGALVFILFLLIIAWPLSLSGGLILYALHRAKIDAKAGREAHA